ncbi:MAG: helix-turn-helix domain-containing protein [Cytophagaceae bacterium]|nr:helix-turn-helix domain-containing protein [Cytophagaceae bacterium]
MNKSLFFLLFLSFFSIKAQIWINYIENSSKVDGDISDWPSLKYSFLQTSHQVKSSNHLRYDFGFDETYLYGVFQVKDKHLTDLAKDKSGSPRLTFNDGIEFYIDTRNNSKTSMDGDDYQLIIDFMGNLTVFRGGDKYLLKVEDYKVPKDTVTNQFIMDFATNFEGTINKENDIDSGYVIEFRIAWAALGIRPLKGQTFRIDVCINDADKYIDIRPLSEKDTIPAYDFQNINRKTDFGFPNNWTLATLKGQPSYWKIFNRYLATYWWFLGLVILGLFLPFLIILVRQNYKLRHIQPKSLSDQSKLNSFLGVEKNVLSQDDAFINQAKQFILTKLDQNISSAQLADELAISVRQLQRIFKEKLDTTPTNFITTIKMEEAAKMLLKNEFNVSEIAYALGFSDPAYFTRLFKKYFGESPSEFTKNLI